MRAVKMRTSAASPRGSFAAGKTYNLPDDLAAEFVDGGAAEYLGHRAPAPAVEAAVAVEPTEDGAAQVEPPKRRRGRPRKAR